MFKTDILVCNGRVEEEQRLADAAPSFEAGMVHLQMAMLYKAQLAMLHRRQLNYEQSLCQSTVQQSLAVNAGVQS